MKKIGNKQCKKIERKRMKKVERKSNGKNWENNAKKLGKKEWKN